MAAFTSSWDAKTSPRLTAKDTRKNQREDARLNRQDGARSKGKSEMFRFNLGKQRKVFPDYNPYTIKKGNVCNLARRKFERRMPMSFVLGCAFPRNCMDSAGCITDKLIGRRLLISTAADKRIWRQTLPWRKCF